jgi:hypothetical protein
VPASTGARVADRDCDGTISRPCPWIEAPDCAMVRFSASSVLEMQCDQSCGRTSGEGEDLLGLLRHVVRVWLSCLPLSPEAADPHLPLPVRLPLSSSTTTTNVSRQLADSTAQSVSCGPADQLAIFFPAGCTREIIPPSWFQVSPRARSLAQFALPGACESISPRAVGFWSNRLALYKKASLWPKRAGSWKYRAF